jgi:hypothetical protein
LFKIKRLNWIVWLKTEMDSSSGNRILHRNNMGVNAKWKFNGIIGINNQYLKNPFKSFNDYFRFRNGYDA